jgi:hypothetical protein
MCSTKTRKSERTIEAGHSEPGAPIFVSITCGRPRHLLHPRRPARRRDRLLGHVQHVVLNLAPLRLQRVTPLPQPRKEPDHEDPESLPLRPLRWTFSDGSGVCIACELGENCWHPDEVIELAEVPPEETAYERTRTHSP